MSHGATTSARSPLLRVRRISFTRGERLLFDGLSFEACPAQVTAILGPNGAGKSTLLAVLSGLVRAQEGDILFDGRPVERWPRQDLARSLAMLQQEGANDVPFTVRELVMLGRSPHQDAFGRSTRQDEAVVDELLEETALTALAARPLHQLSGGERRRAYLAQALAQSPRLLLLDEPTAFLDLKFQARFWEIVSRRVARGLCVIAVLHDPNLAARWADQVVLMPGEGIACQVGDSRELLRRDNLESLYGAGLNEARAEDGQPVFALRSGAERG